MDNDDPKCQEPPEYIIGDLDTNACPASSVPISDPAGCEAAAKVLEYDWGSNSVETEAGFPKGCYLYNKWLWFNWHTTGNPDAGASPVCKTVETQAVTLVSTPEPTSAPTSAPTPVPEPVPSAKEVSGTKGETGEPSEKSAEDIPNKFATPAPSSTSVTSSTTTENPAGLGGSNGDSEQAVESQEEDKNSSSGDTMVVLIIVAVVLIVAGGGIPLGLYFFMQRNSQQRALAASSTRALAGSPTSLDLESKNLDENYAVDDKESPPNATGQNEPTGEAEPELKKAVSTESSGWFGSWFAEQEAAAEEEVVEGEAAKEEFPTFTADSATADFATQDFATQDLATQDFATQDFATQDFATQDLATQDFSTQDFATQDFADAEPAPVPAEQQLPESI